MVGAPAGPYLTNLRALNAGSLMPGGSSMPVPEDWGWLQAARQLRGLALCIPVTTEALQQLWPSLEVGCLACPALLNWLAVGAGKQ